MVKKVYKVASGGIRYVLFEGSEAECEALCEEFHWEYVDENRFAWNLEIDD